jgi:hypothetical protein
MSFQPPTRTTINAGIATHIGIWIAKSEIIPVSLYFYRWPVKLRQCPHSSSFICK